MKNILLILITFYFVSCNSQNKTDQKPLVENHLKSSKINGVTLVATRNPIDASAIKPLTDYNANYAVIVPYAWMKSLEEPQVNYDEKHGWWGEKPQGVKTTIDLMHKQNLEVFLKPQIWIGRGDYTGDILLSNEASWKILEESYTEYIMRFAKIAVQNNVSMFCIGTELDSFVRERPKYWTQLIKSIREIYKGKLTYAGNWDSYKNVSFWDQLDYIGVDAYFPVSNAKTPKLEEVKKRWERWKLEMSTLSRKRNKKILFTEYGYVSADYAGKEPWKNAGEDRQVNEEAQALLFQGLYESVWKEDWLAGGFIWKHHAEDSKWRGFKKRFTPQNKKAQKIIAAAYAKAL